MKPRSRAVRIRKYAVTAYQRTALRSLMPPDDITVSEWAERYRILDTKAAALPGPWNNDKTPYLVGIMDEFCNYETEEIVFCKPTQVGGTEAELNMLGWVIQQDPAPTMCVYPSDTLAKSLTANRLQPMLYASESLRERYRENESTKEELQFDGMYLSMVGSNSPSQLASKPIKYLFLDEVDKYPGASRKEADPISLARERTKTFHNRKIYMTSTPTLRTGHIWKALEGCDVIKHYFVPCPHCGEMIELLWKNIDFPDEEGLTIADRAARAVYRCPECSGIIIDRHKPGMLRGGEWRIVTQNSPFVKKVGFWMNTLYSPFVSFSEIVLEFLKSKDDPEAFQNFVNSWFAEPWEDSSLKTSADLVMERQTSVPEFTVPAWAKLLTGGVDVQQNCFYWTIRAWGDHVTSQNIAHGQAFSFAEVEQVMNLQYTREDDGPSMMVALALIDSGYDADSTYDFCADNSEWALPCKGSSNPMRSRFTVSRVDKASSRAYGMDLVIVDGGAYKDTIAGRLRRDKAPGQWLVHENCDREYAEQITSEHKVNVRSGRKVRQEWVPKASHAANHYLDCEVYAFAAAEMRGVRRMHLEYVPEHQPQQSPPAPEESWIQKNEGWLDGGSWLGATKGGW